MKEIGLDAILHLLDKTVNVQLNPEISSFDRVIARLCLNTRFRSITAYGRLFLYGRLLLLKDGPLLWTQF